MAFDKQSCRSCNGGITNNYSIYLDEYFKYNDNWCVNCADPIYGFSANCNACSDTECTVNYL